MKKILSGLFFRLIKGFEIWVLLALLVISSLYIFNLRIDFDQDLMPEAEYSASKEVSAYDMYRCYTETLPDEVYDKLRQDRSFSSDITCLFSYLNGIHLVPGILILVFIPLFFGRLYSDGTIKNLIACGHSKGRIYLASLIMSFLIDILMLILSICIFAAVCIFYSWYPPVYLPVVIFMLFIELSVLFTVSSVGICVLFASQKKVLSLIAGFVVAVLMFIPVSSFAIMYIASNEQKYDDQSEAFEEYHMIIQEKGANALEERFDILDFNIIMSHDGKDLDFTVKYKIPPVLKTVLLFIIYSDPLMIAHFGSDFDIWINPYLMARDGLMTINVMCDVCWILLSSTIGLSVFKKREIS